MLRDYLKKSGKTGTSAVSSLSITHFDFSICSPFSALQAAHGPYPKGMTELMKKKSGQDLIGRGCWGCDFWWDGNWGGDLSRFLGVSLSWLFSGRGICSWFNESRLRCLTPKRAALNKQQRIKKKPRHRQLIAVVLWQFRSWGRGPVQFSAVNRRVQRQIPGVMESNLFLSCGAIIVPWSLGLCCTSRPL